MCCTVIKVWVRGAPRLGILLLCSLLWRVSRLYNLNAFKTKGSFFCVGKVGAHMLINAPTPLHLLLKFSCIPRHAQLCPLHKTTQNRGSKAPCASETRPSAPLSEVMAFTRISPGHHPNRADPNDLAAVTSEEALMRMTNVLITLQGKVLYLNPYVLGASLPHSWLLRALLVSTHCRGHQSVLDIRSL